MTIHDHFDGCAHCVECGGKCTLTGDELAVTELVRYSLEHMAFAGFRNVPMLMANALQDLGLNPHAVMQRAVQARAKWQSGAKA